VLVGKLKDEDPNVRLMVGGAIAAQGESAAAAVPALIQACQVEGEQVYVLRSFASALGAIGPQATPSLPVLRKLETHTRIRWSARAAIRNITGKPYEPS
jgi:HEAT repeat protein